MKQRLLRLWNSYQRIHWKLVYRGVRLFGILAIVIGAIGTLLNLPTLLDPNSEVLVNGVPRTDLGAKLIDVLMPLLFVGIGILCLFAPPHVPGQTPMFSFLGKRRKDEETKTR